jgi:hypothetical protein
MLQDGQSGSLQFYQLEIRELERERDRERERERERERAQFGTFALDHLAHS